MTAEELYEKEFGDADNIPKESVLRLLRHFAKALELEREQALRIHDVVVELPKVNSKDFKDWLKSEGYKKKVLEFTKKKTKITAINYFINITAIF